MSQITRETPYYSRAVPSEWNGLLTIAQTELAGNSDPSHATIDNAETIRDALTPLSDERVDVNRYFGLGLALCGLAKTLRRPDIRQQLIKQSGESLGKSWQRLDKQNEFDSDASVVGRAFELFVHASTNDMTPDSRLVTDALVVENAIRRLHHESSDTECIRQVVEDLKDRGVLYNRPTADLLSQNVVSGTLALFYKAMGIKGKGVGRLHLAVPNRAPIESHTANVDQPVPTTIEPVTDQELRNMNLQKAAFRIATLRLDEATEAFKTYLAVDPQGQVFIPKDRITSKEELGPPDPKSEPLVLHHSRLTCPAIHVQGLIASLIDIVPEILIEANRYRG